MMTGDLDDDLDPLSDDEGDADAVVDTIRHSVVLAATATGARFDRTLADALASALGEGAPSRSRLQALIAEGRVTADGVTIDDPSARVKGGETVDLAMPAAAPARPRPQAIPLDIRYEDADLLVLDKPPGLVVHPAAGHPDGTLVNALLAHCGDALSGIGGVRRPGIVHRLDKDTGGLMVVAKSDRAHRGLTAQFADRTLSRTYLALVWGSPAPREGTVDAPIGRHPTDRKRMAVVPASGRQAVTHYVTQRVVGLAASLVECRLATGRTHQIRVHMAHLGYPLLGDPLYGRVTAARQRDLSPLKRAAIAGFRRQALHAVALAFVHPVTGDRLQFETGLAPDMSQLLVTLESPF